MNTNIVGSFNKVDYNTPELKELQNNCNPNNENSLSHLHSNLPKAPALKSTVFDGRAVVPQVFQKNIAAAIAAPLFNWQPSHSSAFENFRQYIAKYFAAIRFERFRLEKTTKKNIRYKFKPTVEKSAKSKELGK